jgi:hypothetical protein
LRHLLFLFALLNGCAAPLEVIPRDPARTELFDYDESSDDVVLVVHWEVEGVAAAHVARRFSNRRDDVDCRVAHHSISGSSSPTEDSLSRSGSPERALYEWHLCFVVDDVVYRGWRGFDPGPGSRLSLSCRIDARMAPGDEYACVVTDLRLNADNYAEYALACAGEEECERFEDARTQLIWKQQPPLDRTERLAIAAAVIRDHFRTDSYRGADGWPYFVAVDGEDPPEDCLRSLPKTATFLPGGRFEEGKATRLDVGGYRRLFDGSVEVLYSFYCGSRCAASHTAIVRKDADGWRVLHTVRDWIS